MNSPRFEFGPNPEKDPSTPLPLENQPRHKNYWADIGALPINEALVGLREASHWQFDLNRFEVKTTDSQYNMYSGKLASDKAADVMVTGVTTDSRWSHLNRGSKPIRVLLLKGDRREEDRRIVAGIGEHGLPQQVGYLEDSNVTAYMLARGARRIVRTLANSPYTEGYNERLRQRAVKLAREATKVTGRHIDIEQIGSYANGGDTSPDDIDFFVIPTPTEER